jgi:ribosomal protein S18 acetylase RimI-like enzyme
MVIRPARPRDVEAVLAVWTRADAVPSATDDIDGVRALLAHDPGSLLVADLDGEIVGTLIAAWDGWRGNMYRLAVVPERRRDGIAGALARAGHDRLDALGCRRISAIVVGDHDHAVGFWEDAGYEWQGGIRRYVSGRHAD